MTKIRTFAVLLGAALLASCGEAANQVIAGPEPNGGTRIRFFNFGINAPGVHFYANDTKMVAVAEVGFTADVKTGIASAGTESTTGTVYGGVASNGFYSSIAPGSYQFNARIAATTDNGLQISSLTRAIESGKKYSFFMSGFYDATAKTVEGFVVEDPYSETYDWTNANVRFVNASPNSQPMTMYAKNTTTTVETAMGAAVAYKGAGTFTTLAPGTYDLRTAYTGATTNAITRTAVSFVAGRTYTITARGDMTVVSTTATNRPFLDNTANR
ncbi:MAG TPA: DUF4397 domain-containing protein [Gemmatimonadaceae bacterium]|nr:DUF4397 domain-containing protein [Gemmatimonadaceae bacterium]